LVACAVARPLDMAIKTTAKIKPLFSADKIM
jgi:hypothetical protein